MLAKSILSLELSK